MTPSEQRTYRALRRDGWTAHYALEHARLETVLSDAEAAGMVSVEYVEDAPEAPDWDGRALDEWLRDIESGRIKTYGVVVKVGNVAEASIWGCDVYEHEVGTIACPLRTWARDLYAEEMNWSPF